MAAVESTSIMRRSIWRLRASFRPLKIPQSSTWKLSDDPIFLTNPFTQDPLELRIRPPSKDAALELLNAPSVFSLKNGASGGIHRTDQGSSWDRRGSLRKATAVFMASLRILSVTDSALLSLLSKTRLFLAFQSCQMAFRKMWCQLDGVESFGSLGRDCDLNHESLESLKNVGFPRGRRFSHIWVANAQSRRTWNIVSSCSRHRGQRLVLPL